MDIITSTESCALDMEHNHKENEAETLRQNVSHILQKNLNLKKMVNLECTDLIKVVDSEL